MSTIYNCDGHKECQQKTRQLKSITDSDSDVDGFYYCKWCGNVWYEGKLLDPLERIAQGIFTEPENIVHIAVFLAKELLELKRTVAMLDKSN